MKFLKLEILNLASLDRQGGETICFEEGALADTTIFSIVGATGSGKSTLLDAICLALYNRAPRYPRKKGDRNQNIEIYGEPDDNERNRLAPTDPRNIVTHGKKEGYSKLTFLANNGVTYRAEWYVRQKTKRYDEALTSLYRLTETNGRPTEEIADWNTLPQIVGLDYEQFLRTVLIAQGSFANFLTSKENERYELLEKLTGCQELYTTVAARIKIRRDEAADAFKAINANFSAFEKDLISPDDMARLLVRIEELEAEDKRMRERLVKVNEAILWYTTNEQYLRRIAAYTMAHEQAKKDLDEARPLHERLALHDVTLPAVDLYKELTTLNADVERKRKELTGIATHITQAMENIKAGEKDLESLRQKETEAEELFNREKPHINKALAIRAERNAMQKDVQDKERAWKAANEASRKACKVVKDNADAIVVAASNLKKANEELASLMATIGKRKEQLVDEVAKASKAFSEEHDRFIVQDLEQLQKAKNEAERKHRDLQDAMCIVCDMANLRDTIGQNKDTMASKQKRNEAINAELSGLDMESLTAEIETLRNTHTLMTSETWAVHRQNLIDGSPCPLCGATAHPYHDETVVAPIVTALHQMIQRKSASLRERAKIQSERIDERARNAGTIEALTKQNAELSHRLAMLAEKWNNVRERRADWPDDMAGLEVLVPIVNAEVEEASTALVAYNKQAAKVEKLRKAKEQAEKQERDYLAWADMGQHNLEAKKHNATMALETEKGKTANLVAQQEEKAQSLSEAADVLAKARRLCEEKVAELQAEIGDKDPDEYDRALTKKQAEASEAVGRKEKALNGFREKYNVFVGQKKVTEDIIHDDESKHAKCNEVLREWLSQYNSCHAEPITIDHIATLYSATDDWEAIRQYRKNLDEALTKAQTTLANEQSAHSKHQLSKPESTLEALKEEESKLKQWTAQELADAKARLKCHHDAKNRMGALFEERREAESLMNEWNEVAEAIGGDGKTLRKMAQCYTLRFLIEHANVEIRKFNNRYELLQVKNSLGIRVIDHDRADDVRDTTSLSGGETFIVSLALALGLSALSSRNISFENLFIDEGFGTLDPETLATVIDSLAMLQSSQGKKVGVISHTDTMSERITTQIRIIKNGRSGSSHIEIYPFCNPT